MPESKKSKIKLWKYNDVIMTGKLSLVVCISKNYSCLKSKAAQKYFQQLRHRNNRFKKQITAIGKFHSMSKKILNEERKRLLSDVI